MKKFLRPFAKPCLKKKKFYWLDFKAIPYQAVALAWALFWVASCGEDALAHAYLQKTDPLAGVTLAVSPEHLHFYFSEDIDSKFSELWLVDNQGHRTSQLKFRFSSEDPLKMDISLPKVGEGTYTVAWRVMSAVDGHTTKGTFPFHIGSATASCFDLPPTFNNKKQSDETPPTPWGRVVFHWLSFLAIIGLTGAFFFQIFVIAPALHKTHFPAAHWASVALKKRNRTLWLFWALFIATNLLDLFAQVMGMRELSLSEMLESAVLSDFFQTRYGSIWLARMALALLVGIGLVTRLEQRRWGLWSLVGLSILLLFSISLSSHSAALKENTEVAIALDWLHLIASSVWVGGLLQLLSVFIPALRLIPEQTRYTLIAQVVPRFSNLALLSVILLVLTGLYSAFRQVASLELLFITPYGRAILIKHVLLIFTVGVALVHRLDSVPRLSRMAEWISQANADQAQKLLRRFRGMISVEVLLVLAVLFFAGVLTLVPTAVKSPDEIALTQYSKPITLIESTEDITIELSLCSEFVGDNAIDLILTDFKTQGPLADAQRVLIGFNYVSNPELGGLSTPTESQGDGHYRAHGAFMNVAGAWEITVSVRRVDHPTDILVKFPITVREKAEHAHPDANRIYDPSLIEKGRPLFMQHCMACHGESGRGDGPEASRLKFLPADLVAHRGHHADSDFLAIIRDGTGLVMPSFREKLSEEEILQIIAYIRHLKE
jgi:copper transport protein